MYVLPPKKVRARMYATAVDGDDDKWRETNIFLLLCLKWINHEKKMSRMSLKCHNYPILCRFSFLLSRRLKRSISPVTRQILLLSSRVICCWLLVVFSFSFRFRLWLTAAAVIVVVFVVRLKRWHRHFARDSYVRDPRTRCIIYYLHLLACFGVAFIFVSARFFFVLSPPVNFTFGLMVQWYIRWRRYRRRRRCALIIPKTNAKMVAPIHRPK